MRESKRKNKTVFIDDTTIESLDDPRAILGMDQYIADQYLQNVQNKKKNNDNDYDNDNDYGI